MTRTMSGPRWEGAIRGVSLVFDGKFGWWSFRGSILAGEPDDHEGWWLTRRGVPAGSPPCAPCQSRHERHRGLAELPGVAEAVAGLSAAVESIQIRARGVDLHIDAEARARHLLQDLEQVARLVEALRDWGDPPLLQALKQGDDERMRMLLNEGHSPFELGPGTITLPGAEWPVAESAMRLALARGDLARVGMLGAAPQLGPFDREEALTFAVGTRNADSIKVLLSTAPTPLRAAFLGFPLQRSCHVSWAEGVKLLLAAGARPADAATAVRRASPEVAALLVPRPATEREQETALDAALRRRELWPLRLARRLVGALGRSPSERRSELRAFGYVANRLGLSLRPGDAADLLISVAGKREGMDIAIDCGRDGSTRIQVDAGLPRGLRARPESPLTRRGILRDDAWASPHEGEVVTRDDGFDRDVAVHGPLPETLALLTPENRARLRRFVVELGGELRDGAVVLEFKPPVPDPLRLVAFAEAATEVGAALASRVRQGTLACLHQAALHEDSDYIRVVMLEALATRHPGTPELKEASLRALDGYYDWLRIHGAWHLGEEAVPLLRRTVADGKQRSQIRAAALGSLSDRGLLGEDDVLALAAPVEPLLCEKALQLLGARHGSARSVEALLGIEALGGDLGRAATGALTGIRARLSNTEVGIVSLVAPVPERGGVAVVPDPGQVSLTDPGAGKGG